MPTHPITGARYPTTGSSPNGPQQIQDAVTDLSVQVLPRYATTSARDSAFSAWTSAGNSLAEGMYAYTQAEDTLWYYNGTVWTWPRWARGELGRAEYTSSALLSNSEIGLPSFTVTPSFIPASRRIEVSFDGNISVDTSGTYQFNLYKGVVGSALLRAAPVQLPNSGAATVYFNVRIVFNTTTALTNQQFTVSGLRGSASGTFTLNGTAAFGPCQYSVRDLGAV